MNFIDFQSILLRSDALTSLIPFRNRMSIKTHVSRLTGFMVSQGVIMDHIFDDVDLGPFCCVQISDAHASLIPFRHRMSIKTRDVARLTRFIVSQGVIMGHIFDDVDLGPACQWCVLRISWRAKGRKAGTPAMQTPENVQRTPFAF
jgi:hypothetical protein